MAMIITIPKHKTFDLEEGIFRGRLASISKRPKGKDDSESIRLLFEMQIPTITAGDPFAGRNFSLDLASGSEFRRFLEGWLGKGYLDVRGGKPFDLEELIGREADLVLVHYHKTGYENPMVFIQAAYKPGVLKLTEEPEKEVGASK